jgi:hypothetical protein
MNMNNEKYNQIIDEAYKNYEKNNSKIEYIGSKCSLCGNISNHDTDYPNEYDTNCIHCGKEDKWEHQYKDLPSLTKEEFINKIKTDDDFSKTWNLKIEEKELSLEERRKEMESIGVDFVTINMFFNKTLDLPKQEMYEKKIPTKLITVTYKDETVEIYE